MTILVTNLTIKRETKRNRHYFVGILKMVSNLVDQNEKSQETIMKQPQNFKGQKYNLV